MSRHVIKQTHKDGKELDVPDVWCYRSVNPSDWLYQDVNHVALSVEGSIAPCKNCIKAIIRELEKEL